MANDSYQEILGANHASEGQPTPHCSNSPDMAPRVEILNHAMKSTQGSGDQNERYRRETSDGKQEKPVDDASTDSHLVTFDGYRVAKASGEAEVAGS